MVAAVCAWHEHHENSVRDLERRLGRGERLTVAAPSLVEAYAVLTRLPAPHRLSAADAAALLEANFLTGSTIIALDQKDYGALLKEAPKQGVFGGRAYDWVIARCALKGQVTVLLTFNTRDFLPFSTRELVIAVPGQIVH